MILIRFIMKILICIKDLKPIEDTIKNNFGFEFNKHEINDIKNVINLKNFDKGN